MQSIQKQSKKYLEAQIRTASKEQLLIMLYDGAIHNCTAAQAFMEVNELEKASEKLLKSQNIVAELISTLHFDKNQEVAKNLAALYGYVYLQLMEANTKHSIPQVQNSIQILTKMKETWIQAFEKVGLSKEGIPRDITTPAANTELKTSGSLSVQG